MRLEGYRPRNTHLQRQLDDRWRRWLYGSVAGSAAVGAMLALIVGPRQTAVRLRYEIARVTQEVGNLEDQRRRLVLARESLTSPDALAAAASSLGLEAVPRERIAFLTADGRLVTPPPPPTPTAVTTSSPKKAHR